MNCIHGFNKDVEPPVKGMHRCSCCGLNGRMIYIQAGAKWPRTDPLCQSCRDAEDRLKTKKDGDANFCVELHPRIQKIRKADLAKYATEE